MNIKNLSNQRLEFIKTGSMLGWSWQNKPSQEETYSISAELLALRKLAEDMALSVDTIGGNDVSEDMFNALDAYRREYPKAKS